MDDHDLGALLDASVPAPPASDEALSRIHRRAGQRRRRTALAGGVLTVVVAVGAALGVSAIGASGNGSSRPVPPAGSTTVAPSSDCSDRVTLSIDPQSVDLRADDAVGRLGRQPIGIDCRLVGSDQGDDPRRPRSDPHRRDRHAHRRRLAERARLRERARSRHIHARGPPELDHPCSNGPVELEVAGFSPSPARLKLPPTVHDRTSADRSSRSSRPGPVAGRTCPTRSITLDDRPERRREPVAPSAGPSPQRLGPVFSAGPTPASRRRSRRSTAPCSMRSRATRLGRATSFQDLFVPAHAEFVGYLSWANPCSATPVRLVVRFEDGSYGPAP